MKFRSILPLILALTVLLSSCSQQPIATATSIPVTPTQPQASPSESPTLSAQSVSVTPASCNVNTQIDIPEVTGEDWVIGPEDAAQTFIIYSDFQCPYCAMIEPLMAQYQKENSDKVRYAFRHFPLPSHPKGMVTAQAAEAAGLQKKFFEMARALLANQQAWNDLGDGDFDKWLVDQAKTLGLDVEKFTSDYKSEAMIQKAKDAQNSALAIGINYTPFVVLNGIVYRGALDTTEIENYVKFTEKQYKECPPQVIDPAKIYTATLKTDKGNIVVELYPDKAPFTVNSFVFLAREGWFNNVTFHRVIPGFVAQSGDPLGSGIGSPGFEYGNEISDLKYDQPGRVGMANAGPDTNGSQFFITYTPIPDLDGGYTIFGQVIEGMDVANNLTERQPDDGAVLPPGDKIISVTIEEK